MKLEFYYDELDIGLLFLLDVPIASVLSSRNDFVFFKMIMGLQIWPHYHCIDSHIKVHVLMK